MNWLLYDRDLCHERVKTSSFLTMFVSVLTNKFVHHFMDYSRNRTKQKKLFIWTTKSGETQHHTHTNCTWLFIPNCINASDILHWKWFLHYFWLQKVTQRQILKIINKQKISLTQQLHSLHLKYHLRKNAIRLLVCVPFLLNSICKYGTYVIHDLGVFATLSDI